MTKLSEILAKAHPKEHRKEEKKGGEHHKIDHRHSKKEGKEEKKSKFKYPEMSTKDVEAKTVAGYTFRSAKDADYKDESVSKNIVTIKLPKIGYTPFVMTPPVGGDGSDASSPTHKPMTVTGDPDAKKEETTSSEEKSDKDHVQLQHPLTKKWLKVSKHTGRIVKESKGDKPFKGVPLFKKEHKEETTSTAVLPGDRKQHSVDSKQIKSLSKEYDELCKHYDKASKKDATAEHKQAFKKKSAELLVKARAAEKVIKNPVTMDKLKDDIIKGIRRMDTDIGKSGKHKAVAEEKRETPAVPSKDLNPPKKRETLKEYYTRRATKHEEAAAHHKTKSEKAKGDKAEKHKKLSETHKEGASVMHKLAKLFS